MESLRPPQWTLLARMRDGMLDLSLGDGMRLAWHASRPADLLEREARFATAADFFGNELAAQLLGSMPRPLCVLYDGDSALDRVDWEQIGLGAGIVAERFALARQLLRDTDSPIPAPMPLADALVVAVVHDGDSRTYTAAQVIEWGELEQRWACEAVGSAHVLVLDGVPLARFLERAGSLRPQHLLVLAEPVSTGQLARVLDAGAAALCLRNACDLCGDRVQRLVQQLGNGLSVGEAVCWVQARLKPNWLEARLYGDPKMRFVHLAEPTSRRQVTSLSYDLVGSTELIGMLGNEAFAEKLAAVHACCASIVRHRGGRPDDPQGDDGVMCYFGHPVAVENAAARAVEAGLEIVRSVARLDVAVRVGIATDLVAVKGSQPIGLSVNLAARLQKDVAAPGTVVVSEGTYELIADAFEFTHLVSLPPLKGIDASGTAYLVLGPSRDASKHRLDRLPALTQLVGRQPELDRLNECWRATCAGGGRLAVISGEAGIGKSRLVREFRRRLVESDAKVLECNCREDANASPFLTLTEGLRHWLDIGPDDGAEVVQRKLAANIPGHVPESEPLALLAALLGITSTLPAARPEGSRRRLLILLVDWFRAFAYDRRCCLIIEDWHWVDPSMSEFVERLVAGGGVPGLLVMVTVREKVSAPPLPSVAHERIELSGLPAEAARMLVNHVCADSPLSPRLVAELAARGDGVPLFIEEATRMALKLGTHGAIAEQHLLAEVPASLWNLLMMRLDGLGTAGRAGQVDAKRIAQVAAVLGRQFSRAMLSALLDAMGHAVDAAELDNRLAELTESGLVRPEEDSRYAFRHALIRDAAYALLGERDCQSLHEHVVTLLQRRWPGTAESQPELLALHQQKAGLHAQALAQWMLAAKQARARSAEREAISHLRAALSLAAQPEAGVVPDRTRLGLQLQLAACLIATEGYGNNAVYQAYLEAERLCASTGDEGSRFKVEMGLEAFRFMRADFGLALEHGRRAADIAARSHDIRQRLHAHWGLACTLFHQGDLRATMREMETALSIYGTLLDALEPDAASPFGTQDPGVMCMAYSSWGLWEIGRPDLALQRIEDAISTARRFEHRFSEAVALAYAVSVELLRGETEAALARSEACSRVCEKFCFPVWLAINQCMRGYLLCERGQFEDGVVEMNAGYKQWLATGSMVSQPLYLTLQASGLMLAGDLDAASQRVEEGLEIIQRYGERQLEAELTRQRGELALRRGDVVEGEALLKRAYMLALRKHRLGFALRSATALARHWAATGRPERALGLLEPLVKRWKEGLDTRDVRVASQLVEALR
jgi:class 3 adenylate cyclase/tetratricopeptide (TPR) repeat protein